MTPEARKAVFLVGAVAAAIIAIPIVTTLAWLVALLIRWLIS